MKHILSLLTVFFVLVPLLASAQDYTTAKGKIKVFIVKNRTEGPSIMERSGLIDRLTDLGCDAAKVCAKDAPSPVNVVLFESATPLHTGIGVKIIIARMNSAKVDLLIAGIFLCPSKAPLTGAKIRLFLPATLYQFGNRSSSVFPRKVHNFLRAYLYVKA